MATSIATRAKAAFKRRGAAVTFSKVTQTYDAATDTMVPTTSTVTGHAVQVDGDVERYKQLGLVLSAAPSLLFAPDTGGQKPEHGSTVVWAGKTYTVRDVDPRGLDGSADFCRIVVSV